EEQFIDATSSGVAKIVRKRLLGMRCVRQLLPRFFAIARSDSDEGTKPLQSQVPLTIAAAQGFQRFVPFPAARSDQTSLDEGHSLIGLEVERCLALLEGLVELPLLSENRRAADMGFRARLLRLELNRPRVVFERSFQLAAELPNPGAMEPSRVV